MRSLPDIRTAQKQLQRIQETRMRPMSNLNRSPQDTYSETEAAAALGITVARLHELLDKHIFTEGNKRPKSIEFTASDLLLLSYWNQDSKHGPTREVIQMPRRK
jgi:prophage maintenance system killer protein